MVDIAQYSFAELDKKKLHIKKIEQKDSCFSPE